jgi:hypothetical protein
MRPRQPQVIAKEVDQQRPVFHFGANLGAIDGHG